MSAPVDLGTQGDAPADSFTHAGDVLVAVLVGLAFAAARLLTWIPAPLTIAVALLGLITIRPKLLVVAAFLFVGWHAGHDLSALEPATTRPLTDVEALLTSDPKDNSQVVSVQAEIAGERVLVSARSTQAAVLRRASSGDRVQLTGTLSGSRPSSSWRISRRIVGQVTVTDARFVRAAPGPTGAANSLRHVMRSGARTLAPDRQVLFTGLVFGDDRGQDPIVADNFRAAGLGHLLAVSGQNVVFVLLLAAPAVGRISSVPMRVGLSLAILVGFGFITRFEPSVSRALVMAGLALVAHAVGRPGSAATLLPPAVLGLLLFDPLLAWSLAFQLSVLATLGLVILTPRIAAHVRGPKVLVVAVSATLGAQAAVSPLLIATFGTVSAVAVPANLLAGPAAAGVMMWGLVAGTIAGLSPAPIAEAIHLPTRVMLWWISEVAEVFARLPVGHVRLSHLLTLVILAGAGANLQRLPPKTRGPLARVLGGVLIGTVVITFVTPRQLSVGHHRLLDGVEVVRAESGHDVVLLRGAPRVQETIAALRQARLGTIDVVVAEEGSRDVGRLVRLLSKRFEITEIWGPVNHEVPGALTVDPLVGTIGSIVIGIGPSGELVVSPCRSDNVARNALPPTDDRARR